MDAKPTRPVVPIELDCARTLKADMNAIAACKTVTGVGFLRAVTQLDDYVRALAGFANRNPGDRLTSEELDAAEPPAALIVGLLHCLLQHQWIKRPPEAPILSPEQVGALTSFESLPEIATAITRAIAGNLAVPGEAQMEGANGQDPLSPPATTTTGMPSSQSDGTISV